MASFNFFHYTIVMKTNQEMKTRLEMNILRLHHLFSPILPPPHRWNRNYTIPAPRKQGRKAWVRPFPPRGRRFHRKWRQSRHKGRRLVWNRSTSIISIPDSASHDRDRKSFRRLQIHHFEYSTMPT